MVADFTQKTKDFGLNPSNNKGPTKRGAYLKKIANHNQRL